MGWAFKKNMSQQNKLTARAKKENRTIEMHKHKNRMCIDVKLNYDENSPEFKFPYFTVTATFIPNDKFIKFAIAGKATEEVIEHYRRCEKQGIAIRVSQSVSFATDKWEQMFGGLLANVLDPIMIDTFAFNMRDQFNEIAKTDRFKKGYEKAKSEKVKDEGNKIILPSGYDKK